MTANDISVRPAKYNPLSAKVPSRNILVTNLWNYRQSSTNLNRPRFFADQKTLELLSNT